MNSVSWKGLRPICVATHLSLFWRQSYVFPVTDEQIFSTAFEEQSFGDLQKSLVQVQEELDQQRHLAMQTCTQTEAETEPLTTVDATPAHSDASTVDDMTGAFSACLLSETEQRDYLRKLKLEKPVYEISGSPDRSEEGEEPSEDPMCEAGALVLWQEQARSEQQS